MDKLFVFPIYIFYFVKIKKKSFPQCSLFIEKIWDLIEIHLKMILAVIDNHI